MAGSHTVWYNQFHIAGPATEKAQVPWEWEFPLPCTPLICSNAVEVFKRRVKRSTCKQVVLLTFAFGAPDHLHSSKHQGTHVTGRLLAALFWHCVHHTVHGLRRSATHITVRAGLSIVPVVPWEGAPSQGGPADQLPNFYHAVLTFERSVVRLNVTTTKKGRRQVGDRFSTNKKVADLVGDQVGDLVSDNLWQDRSNGIWA